MDIELNKINPHVPRDLLKQEKPCTMHSACSSVSDGCSQWCKRSFSRLSPIPSQFLMGLNVGKKEEEAGQKGMREERRKEGRREEKEEREGGRKGNTKAEI